jgi:hypothetical protein
MIQIRVDVKEWLIWAKGSKIRSEILSFITFMPETLMRPVPAEPVPFSTPRAWASLSRALDLAEAAHILSVPIRRALAFGRLTAQDAAIFCAMAEESIDGLLPLEDYIRQPSLLPTEDTARWFVLCRIRSLVKRRELNGVAPDEVNRFLMGLPEEHRFALLVDMVAEWGALGASTALIETLRSVTGL